MSSSTTSQATPIPPSQGPWPIDVPVPVSVTAILLPPGAPTPSSTEYHFLWNSTTVGSATPPPTATDTLNPPDTTIFSGAADRDFFVSTTSVGWVGKGHSFTVTSTATPFTTITASGTGTVFSNTTASQWTQTVISTYYASFDVVVLTSNSLKNTSETSKHFPAYSTTGKDLKVTFFTTKPAANQTVDSSFLGKRQAGTTTSVSNAFITIASSQILNKSGGGLSAGAGSGIGIGCAILGALIGLIVGFCIFRGKRNRSTGQTRRSRSKSPSQGYESYGMTKSNVQTATNTVSIPNDSTAAIVYNNKPQPKEDNAISDEFSRLRSRIIGHVDTYYLRSGGAEKPALDTLAHIWAAQAPISVDRVSRLLADSRSRPHVLRTALAWVITTRMMPGGGEPNSFLPANIAGAYAGLTSNHMDSQTCCAFLSEWRVITAALSTDLYGKEVFTSEDPRMPDIQAVLRQADVFLAPFSNTGDQHEARLRNLEEVMKRAARLAWMLFSQPSGFEIDWAGESSGVVVFPGLLQVTDDNGRPTRRPRSFGQKETVPM